LEQNNLEVTEALDRDRLIEEMQERIRTVLDPLVPDEHLALVDFPDHPNVGDSAIWLGEIAYLDRERRTRPRFSDSVYNHSKERLKNSKTDGPILIHGGGNFGTIWPRHHQLRLSVLDEFRGRPVIQMPQSIHFADDAAADETARAIERHGAFTLLVRDHKSLAFARRRFQCDVQLCPDMAFYIGAVERQRATLDFLCLIRTDPESAGALQWPADSGSLQAVDWLDESRLQHRLHRLVAHVGHCFNQENDRHVAVFNAAAVDRFRRGVTLLSKGRVVITDRLHAHIMSLLLDIPHVVLDNSYGKLSSFMEAWTGRYAKVRTAQTAEAAVREGQALLLA
jgi:exopolysaccharide biosynthesis predicted pyruvyltransferase EpsI